MVKSIGSSEIRKENLIIFVIFVSCFLETRGSINSSREVKIRVIIIGSNMSFYLELHQGLWFLRPRDYYYPLKVKGSEVLISGVRVSSSISPFGQEEKYLLLGSRPSVLLNYLGVSRLTLSLV